jgi:hypothetical protein
VSGEAGPFDVVEEFNRSLENWAMGVAAPASSVPGAAQIHATILHIGQFIAEFSVRGDVSPPFIRPGVGMEALARFRVTFGSIQELLREGEREGEKEEEEAKKTVGVKVKPVVPMFPSQQMVGSNLYLYLRWMWIQCPWLALMHAGTAVPGPTAKAALGRTDAAACNSLFSEGSLAGVGVTADALGFPLDGTGPSGGLSGSGRGSDKGRGRRFWTVKKADPTVPLFEYTLPKRTANINTALTPSSYMNTLEAVVQRVRDDIKAEIRDPDNRLTPVKEKIDLSVRRLPRFRRSLDQDVEAYKQVAFSAHSLKTQNRGTMFPSIEAARRAQHKQMEEDQPDLYVLANVVKRRGGQADPFGPSVEEEIRQLRDDEDLKAYNDKRGYPIPVTGEGEVYYEKECLRVEKLRRLMDRVTAKVAERRADLRALRYSVKTRDVHDEELAADVMAGDAALESLEGRIDDMTCALDDAKALGQGYEELIEMLKSHPPYTDAHIRAQEQALVLARQQLDDLQEHRSKTLQESETIEVHRKGQIVEKITYYRNARQDVRQQLYKLYRDAWDKKQTVPPPRKDGLLYRFYKKIKKRLVLRKRSQRAKRRAALVAKFMRIQVEQKKSFHATPGRNFAAPMISERSKSGRSFGAGLGSRDGSTSPGGNQGPVFGSGSGSGPVVLPASVMAAAEDLTKQRGGQVRDHAKSQNQNQNQDQGNGQGQFLSHSHSQKAVNFDSRCSHQPFLACVVMSHCIIESLRPFLIFKALPSPPLPSSPLAC